MAYHSGYGAHGAWGAGRARARADPPEDGVGGAARSPLRERAAVTAAQGGGCHSDSCPVRLGHASRTSPSAQTRDQIGRWVSHCWDLPCPTRA